MDTPAFDFNSLAMSEIAIIEKLGGQGIGTLSDGAAPKGATLAAIAYVMKKRTDPSFSWNAAQALTFAEVTGMLALTTDNADADEEGDAPKATKSARSTTSA